MSACVYRVVLDGRERECVSNGEGHTVHMYPRVQGRARFEFVELTNVAQVGESPASGTRWDVPGAGAATAQGPA